MNAKPYTPEMRAADAEIHNAIYGPWDETRCRVCGWPVKEKIRDGCTKDVCSMVDREGKRADEPRRFHESHDARAALLEWLAADEGRWWDFQYALCDVLGIKNRLMFRDVAPFMRATPAQVAAAALRVIKESEGGKA